MNSNIWDTASVFVNCRLWDLDFDTGRSTKWNRFVAAVFTDEREPSLYLSIIFIKSLSLELTVWPTVIVILILA